jgi:flagellar biosynthetic protein FliO
LVLAALAAWQCAAAGAHAQTQPASQPSHDASAGKEGGKVGTPERRPLSNDLGEGWREMLRTVGALAVVVGLIFAARFLAGRFGGKSDLPGAGRPLHVIDRRSVGPKQQLMVVRFGGRVLLVGVAAGTMTTLSEIPEGQEAEALLSRENTEAHLAPQVAASGN